MKLGNNVPDTLQIDFLFALHYSRRETVSKALFRIKGSILLLESRYVMHCLMHFSKHEIRLHFRSRSNIIKHHRYFSEKKSLFHYSKRDIMSMSITIFGTCSFSDGGFSKRNNCHQTFGDDIQRHSRV